MGELSTDDVLYLVEGWLTGGPAGIYLSWSWCLAANLATAGGLCEAFALGYEQHSHEQSYSNHGYRLDEDWRPGCGKPAPGMDRESKP